MAQSPDIAAGSPLRATWSARPEAAATALILPDGCRDLICAEAPGAPARWFLSPLQSRARAVPLASGTRLTGFRLAAGVQTDPALLPLLGTRAPDPDDILPLLGEFTRLDANTDEALRCLAGAAGAAGVARAARELGTGLRSLQRLLRRHTGQGPAFWRQLARVRHAARLVGEMPLAEAALTAGFADQAHMSRAFQHWFGVSPGRFRSRPELLAQARSRAYG